MSKKSKKKTNSRPFLHLLIVLFIFVTGAIIGFSVYISKHSKSIHSETACLQDVCTPFTIPAYFSTDLSKKNLVPSPTPYTGYCLYIPILFYHHVQTQSQATEKGQTALSVDNTTFDQQMAYLASSGYTTLTADALVQALLTKSPLPPKSVLVTLDDGYRDNYDYAFPILKKYNIMANIMLSAGLVEGSDFLTWGQIEEMSRSGRVYFTNHTWSHFALPQGSDQKIKDEVVNAKTLIEKHIQNPLTTLTYPYGSFDDRVIRILQELGIKGAFSTIPGSYQCDSFVMSLHRTRIGNASLSSYGL